MEKILNEIDQRLAKERDKKLYRHKGKRKSTIKTIMGEVEFERVIYETVNDEREKAHVFLLDQAIGLETFGKISTNLALKILEHASISSFRNAANNISSTTGQSISHGGKAELKVAVAYDGWEKKGKDRYHLRNKIAVAGFDDTVHYQLDPFHLNRDIMQK